MKKFVTVYQGGIDKKKYFIDYDEVKDGEFTRNRKCLGVSNSQEKSEGIAKRLARRRGAEFVSWENGRPTAYNSKEG